MCIRDSDKLNLVWQFDFRPKPFFRYCPNCLKKILINSKWLKVSLVKARKRTLCLANFPTSLWNTLSGSSINDVPNRNWRGTRILWQQCSNLITKKCDNEEGVKMWDFTYGRAQKVFRTGCVVAFSDCNFSNQNMMPLLW